MADPRNCLTNQPLDLNQILEEATHRWLRPIEILEILGNYQKFKLSPEPPLRPSAGSLFLFDRKALRYFRKDGHCWRKKKDGKTVREAHEKLKAGSVDVLHCYYAHGEENDSFQRRCYWMLDGKLEHIVLVHYREVKEGYRSGVSHVLADPGIQVDRPQPSPAPSFERTSSPAFIAQTFCTSIPNRINWNGQALSSNVHVHPEDDLGASSLSEPISNTLSHNASLLAAEVEGSPVVQRNLPGMWFIGSKFDQSSGSSLLPGISCFNKSAHHMHDQKNNVAQRGGTDFISHKLTDSRLDGDVPDTAAIEDRLITDIAGTAHQRSHQIDNKPKVVEANNNAVGELKKLDSFGRWMDKEIGGDCNDSLMASDSGKYWSTLGAENDDKEVSSLSHHMQLDVESMGPSLSQEQLFSIHDFSPDWAFSGVETKVLIIGTFLGSKKFSSESKWGCMFGEIEVFAEVLTDNAIRCQAPIHATGRVPFYVTCRNRLACSEVREFEYRENSARITSVSSRSVQEVELQFQVRLVKLLCLCPERTSLNCSTEGCGKCKLISNLNSMRNDRKNDWTSDGQSCMVSGVNCMNARDKLIQSLLKDKFFEWLVFKVHGGGKGPDVLDNEGQGVIHLAAALGYEWSMALIVAATNNPNFRDALGRTALHWASYFGREETVITLVRLGVDPTAVDDPTAAFPGGRIAADLASSQGHKGIAGYLAEAFLTRNLSTLNIKENATDSVSASITAEEATAIRAKITFQSNGEADDQVSLRELLAVVRKSTLAAALIQAAYRSYSLHHGKLPKSQDDSEVSLGLPGLCPMNKNRGRTHFEDYLHSAAVKIQQKYRGWKGRRDYIKMRLKVLKIQAHVRGNRVRKQYKKVIWSVSIVEKAILRWRRKGSGLRGFRVEKTIGNAKPETDKTGEYEFLRVSREQKFAGVEKALERVKSMVRDPAARDQYMRLVSKAENLKMDDEGIRESRQDECLQ